MGISPRRVPVWESGRGGGPRLPCTLKRRISLYESSAREALNEDNFTKEGSGKGASVSIGTPLGARKEVCFTGDFEKKVKYFFYRDTLFIGDSARYVKGDCEKGQLSL